MLEGKVSENSAEMKDLEKRLEALSITNGQLLYCLKEPFTHVLFDYLDDKSLFCFGYTCQQLKAWTQPQREQSFLQAVVYGNQASAQAMLKFDPTLLEVSQTSAIEYSGKVIQNVTPFQAALLADDIDMAEMMKPFFDRLKDGQAKMQAQIKALFQESIEAYRKANAHKKEAFDFKAAFPDIIKAHREAQVKAAFDFSEIMQAILDEPHDDVIKKALDKEFDNNLPLHKALDNYRKLFTDIALNEKAFNIHHFLKALEQYDNAFNRTDNWNKRRLIWRQVVGWTQRFFSACWGQAAAQGVYYIVENKEKLRRTFEFRNDKSSIFPLIDKDGVGYCFAALVHRWRSVRPGCWPCSGFKNYYWQKQQVLQTYFRAKTGRETVCNLLK